MDFYSLTSIFEKVTALRFGLLTNPDGKAALHRYFNSTLSVPSLLVLFNPFIYYYVRIKYFTHNNLRNERCIGSILC